MGSWKPSPRDLEVIAEAAAAGMGAAWTAAKLGVCPATLAAFQGRLERGRAAEAAILEAEFETLRSRARAARLARPLGTASDA